MGHRKTKDRHWKKGRDRSGSAPSGKKASPEKPRQKQLEIVLKCDTSGCVEAVKEGIAAIAVPGVEITVIGSGVGAVSKSDLFLAETGSRLVIGFNVGLAPHIERDAAEHNVEIRLYDVIYRLLEDLEMIAASLVPEEPGEKILGSAQVIALFKSSRKGIIIGCEILEGRLALGDSFRILGAMGPVYSGKIESLHIEKDAVRQAVKGQRAGIKIRDFNRVAVGDLVEASQPAGRGAGSEKPWTPRGAVFHFHSIE
ncbi:MAG: hypothetical protein Kow0089_07130 [Desulfobulbaceae bacterium]